MRERPITRTSPRSLLAALTALTLLFLGLLSDSDPRFGPVSDGRTLVSTATSHDATPAAAVRDWTSAATETVGHPLPSQSGWVVLAALLAAITLARLARRRVPARVTVPRIGSTPAPQRAPPLSG